MPRPLIIGHRGASAIACENSVRAFSIAARRGTDSSCDGVELDIRTTIDGRFVVHHDGRVANGKRISASTYDELRRVRLPDGSPVPLLDQVLTVLAGLDVFIELKHVPAEHDHALLELLREHPGCRVQLHAFDHRLIARFHRNDPTLRLGVLARNYPADPLRRVHVAGAQTLWQPARQIDVGLVRRCHRAAIAVIAWTVNDAAQARQLARLGVDGLCGNWPARLRISD